MTSRHHRRRVAWAGFAVGAVVLLIVLGWLSRSLLRLEAEEAEARGLLVHEQIMSDAAWRMDGRMSQRLAAESSRPYFHYLPVYPLDRAYHRLLEPPGTGEPTVPSPLRTFDDPVILFHVQVDEVGGVLCPELPGGALRPPPLDDPRQQRRMAMLDALRPQLGGAPLSQRVDEVVQCQTALVEEVTNNDAAPRGWAEQSDDSALKAKIDYAQRLVASNRAQNWLAAAPGGVRVGPFVPVWLDEPGDDEAVDGETLMYFRRVEAGGRSVLQGFLVDWTALRREMLSEADGLLDHAGLATLPTPLPEDEEGVPLEREDGQLRLATVPALLESEYVADPSTASTLSSARATLGIAWLAVLAAIGGAGLTLRATLSDADRRTRFAGTVTHELRTPLTTFQLYTDLLADDMVPPEKRAAYLRTLRDESHRLGELVENVLAYARIEQGRHTTQRERLTPSALIERIADPLRRRADEAGATLRIEDATSGDRRYELDPDSVARIVFNLVDNAAKYGVPDAAECAAVPEAAGSTNGSAAGRPSVLPDATVELRAESLDGRLHLVVVDHGPGVCPGQRSTLFRPFERGADDRTQARRGIGLGLALSRELARAMGGDLRHEVTPGGGATFRLVVGA